MSRRTIGCFLILGLYQTALAFENELRFVEGLTREGFPDLARTVLSRTLRNFPEAEPSAPPLRVHILIAEKKFSEAQEKIAELAEPAPLTLALAEAAYRARQKPAALDAYQRWFSLGPPPVGTRFEAALHYGELLEETGATAKAFALYDQTVSGAQAGKEGRPVRAALARLLVADEKPAEEILTRAQKLCEDVQLGGLDLWFGQAVVTWAQVMTLREEWDEALSVLETQLELLRQLEVVLAEQGQPVSLISPLAGARYWLGICYEHEEKRAEALTQFYNVYVQYGDSPWGPKAQEKAQALMAYFEGQGKTVKIDLGANRAKMEESAFRVARRLFFEKQYAEAVPVYLDALNEYPEGDEAVTAIRELCLSAIHLGDDLHSKAVGHYLSERFAGIPAAGDALLSAGKGALDNRQEPLAWWMYNRYLDAFPAHPRAAGVLYSLAALRRQNGDTEGAAILLNRIVEDYPDSTTHARALGRLAWNAFEVKDWAAAAAQFAPYVEAEVDPKQKTQAQFAMADSYRQLALASPDRSSVWKNEGVQAQPASSDWKTALEIFQVLETSLAAAVERFGVPEETLAFNRPFLEKSVFYQAACLARLGEAGRAVETYARFIETFPEAEAIPQARLAQAQVLIENRRFVEALAALEPFDETAERKHLEPALFWRGTALFETGRNEEAIQTLEMLLNAWPATAFFVDTQFVQGRAHAAAGQAEEAIRLFGDLLNIASDDLLIHRISLELGRAQADPSEKLASFQRVALLGDPENREHAVLIAEALFESLPLYLGLTRYDDLLADSDRLLADFPNIGKAGEIAAFRKQAQQKLEELKNEPSA